ncbi:hypothetical protein QBC38DRAFT_286542 [Podospora fimiseda]|uniref:Rhodopsin domain-containing protein n=1 Tax=Podospora fimiseda TaxID=252190 RepID=A0AAN7GTY6_9PEZI|nr:hypothetical protein QBC38DRAFT_286542 [Podospora fimiseda]
MDSPNPSPPPPPTNFTIPQPPWGPTPPTNAGRSLQPDIIACSIITWLIASGFVGLRFYTRSRLKNGIGSNHRVLGASDWFILPALVCAAGVVASSLEQVARGAGKHAWEVDFFGIPAMERAAWYGILFYNLSLVFSRISILLLYRRIFTYRWTKRAIQVVLVLVIAIGLWLVVSVCTACVPLEAFWNWGLFWTQKVYCQPGSVWWANAALHVASDLVIMALPMPVLSALKLPRRQKYALVGVFALGFFVCIVSILRIVAMIDVFSKQAVDATYTAATMIYWTTIEVNAAISCACIMTLKPLIQKIFPRLLKGPVSRSSGGTRSGPHNTDAGWIPERSTRRGSRQSYNGMIIAMGGGRPGSYHASDGSGSGGSSKRKGSLLLGPHVEEYEGGPGLDMMDYAEYGLLKPTPGDIEAQSPTSPGRGVCSISTGVEEGDTPRGFNTGNEVGGHGVRSPARAHLKLAIQVTRSVKVEKFPRSPTPGEKTFEEAGDTGKVRRVSSDEESPGGSGRGRGQRISGSSILLGRTRTRSL